MSVEALDSQPELFSELQIIWKAFNDLHRSRTIGFSGANPISITDILSWLELHGFDEETRLEYFELLSAMDDEWLDWARKRDRESEKGMNK